MTFTSAFLVLVLAAVPQQNGAEQPSANDSQRPVLNPAELPVSVDRIQRELAEPPAIRVEEPKLESDSGLPMFRVRVEGDKITIEDILGPDYLVGPVPYGGMTHQEFLDMVTPKDVQGYAAFSNKQGLIVAATSIALKWALQKAVHEYNEAKNAREKEAARKEVAEALEALRKARREAGLPDK